MYLTMGNFLFLLACYHLNCNSRNNGRRNRNVDFEEKLERIKNEFAQREAILEERIASLEDVVASYDEQSHSLPEADQSLAEGVDGNLDHSAEEESQTGHPEGRHASEVTQRRGRDKAKTSGRRRARSRGHRAVR